MIRATFLLVLISLGLTGCLTSHIEFDESGINNVHHGYTLAYVEPKARLFIDKSWRLRNYIWDASLQETKPKETSEFAGYISYDRNDDGEYEREKAAYFDLVLEHGETDGEI